MAFGVWSLVFGVGCIWLGVRALTSMKTAMRSDGPSGFGGERSMPTIGVGGRTYMICVRVSSTIRARFFSVSFSRIW